MTYEMLTDEQNAEVSRYVEAVRSALATILKDAETEEGLLSVEKAALMGVALDHVAESYAKNMQEMMAAQISAKYQKEVDESSNTD